MIHQLFARYTELIGNAQRIAFPIWRSANDSVRSFFAFRLHLCHEIINFHLRVTIRIDCRDVFTQRVKMR